MVLWFPLALKVSHQWLHKDLESSLGNNQVRFVYMRVYLFHLVLSPLFYSLHFFPQKLEIIERDLKTSVRFHIKMHIYIEKNNHTKMSINSQKKHLFHIRQRR